MSQRRKKEKGKKEIRIKNRINWYLNIRVKGITVISLIFALKIIQKEIDFRWGAVEIVVSHLGAWEEMIHFVSSPTVVALRN